MTAPSIAPPSYDVIDTSKGSEDEEKESKEDDADASKQPEEPPPEEQPGADSVEGEDPDSLRKEAVEVLSERKGAPSEELAQVPPADKATLGKIEDVGIIVAAYSFVSAVVPVVKIRSELLQNKAFILASSTLVLQHEFPELRFEAVRLVAKLAPYAAADDVLSPERVCDLLQSALSMDPAIKAGSPPLLSRNSLHISAVTGIQFVFDCLPGQKQVSVINEVVSRYAKVLRNHTVARATTKGGERTNGGELAYNLTTLLLLAKGKDSVEQCFTPQLMTSLVTTVQWRYDPKTTIDETELTFWDASVAQCLQVLALVLWRHEESLAKTGIDVKGLKNTVLMVARPGKAPRKAIDFPSALAIVVKHGEPAAKIAATRIIDCMSL